MEKTAHLVGHHNQVIDDNYDDEKQTICINISKELEKNKNSNLSIKDISKIIKEYSSINHLKTIPKNSDIIRYLPKNSDIRKMMMVKPVKTASGILVIALMAKPFECPHGRCIYCPGGVEFNTPLSYTGKEPVTTMAQKLSYEPDKQIEVRIKQAYTRGHEISKVELVVVGGTFPFMPEDYQTNFVKKCFDSLNGKDSKNIDEAKKLNETSEIRCVGFTIETKPDFCKQNHIDLMLDLGITRIEIGIQTLQEEVYKKVNRGHTLFDVIESFEMAKEAGYKIVAHMMPGLPGSNLDKDLEDFKRLFEDPKLKPDMIKIYPTLVLKNTGLFKLYENNLYHPYSNDEFVNLLIEVKKMVPSWVRIMRIQREINSDDILGGPKSGNLRQILQERLKEQGFLCRCIRCREAGLKKFSFLKNSETRMEMKRIDYQSSTGNETFLSIENQDNTTLFGFLRLRKLSNPYRTELREENGSASAVVRELHVFGHVVNIGMRDLDSYQHQGLGLQLLSKAEDIVKNEYGLNKLSIISAVGTRAYYRKNGYFLNGPYMSKLL